MQTGLSFPEPRTHGGRRKGAGRSKGRSGVPHARRARVSPHDPRLVTTRLVDGLPSLRWKKPGKVVWRCIREAQRDDFRIVHFSIQSNHMHLIVEADDEASLGGGMKGLTRRIAHRLNRLWKRSGKLFADRFHDEVLRSLRRIRHALRYVLNNDLKHGCRPDRAIDLPDPFSSGAFFDGWAERNGQPPPCARGAPVVPGRWKLSVGWKRYAPIEVTELPTSSSTRQYSLA